MKQYQRLEGFKRRKVVRRLSGQSSGANEAGVETAGYGYVRGALDNSASVGKQGQCVLSAFKAQKQIVGPDLAVWFEAGFEFDEIDRTAMFMDLYGVAPAERDVWTALTPQMPEVVLPADFAIRSRMA